MAGLFAKKRDGGMFTRRNNMPPLGEQLANYFKSAIDEYSSEFMLRAASSMAASVSAYLDKLHNELEAIKSAGNRAHVEALDELRAIEGRGDSGNFLSALTSLGRRFTESECSEPNNSRSSD